MVAWLPFFVKLNSLKLNGASFLLAVPISPKPKQVLARGKLRLVKNNKAKAYLSKEALGGTPAWSFCYNRLSKKWRAESAGGLSEAVVAGAKEPPVP